MRDSTVVQILEDYLDDSVSINLDHERRGLALLIYNGRRLLGTILEDGKFLPAPLTTLSIEELVYVIATGLGGYV